MKPFERDRLRRIAVVFQRRRRLRDLAPLDVPAKALPDADGRYQPGNASVRSGLRSVPTGTSCGETAEEARAFADTRAADTVKTIPGDA